MAGCSKDMMNVSNIHTHIQTSSCCYVCNGYYGSSFGEHICQTCHLFLYSNELNDAVQKRNVPLSELRKKVFNGNDETADQNLAQQLQLLSEMPARLPQPSNGDGDYFQDLPPEILLTVFSYLDDFSLWCVSKVCTRWYQLLRSHIPQTWCRFVSNCWPLYAPLRPIDDWHSVSSQLISSSSCISCLRRMFYRPHTEYQKNLWTINNIIYRRLRVEMQNLQSDPPEGIRAVPLDTYLYHWQATILGPAGSPFEGGKFFLYIQIPFGFPMYAPVVRFITKIFHPNISRHGDIGFDFHYNWYMALTISKLLLSIQSLLTDPFCDVCMEPDIARIYNYDRQLYDNIARFWTHKFAMND